MGIIQRFWQFVKNTSSVSACAVFLAFFFYSSVFISAIAGAFICGGLFLLSIFNKISKKTLGGAVFAGVLCIFALFNLQNRQKNVLSLIENEKITKIYGFCTNSPVKIENGSYLITLKCFAVGGSLPKAEIICTAKGFVNVILPQHYVENYYPGKVGIKFSPNGKNSPGNPNSESGRNFLLVDTGLPLAVYGHFSGSGTGIKYFNAESVKSVNLSIIKNYASKKTALMHSGFLHGAYRMRAELRIKLKKVLFSFGKSGWFLLALFCGSREYLDPFLKQNFMRAGVSHILALSGMHLSLVTGSARKFAGIFAGAKLTGFIIFVFAWVFVLFASSAPSLNRALLFVFFSILARKLCVRPVLTKVLSLSFILQLLFNAQQAQTGAFLLSYGAMLGIGLILPLFAKKIEKIPGWLKKIANTLATCFAAQCGTLPLTLFLYKSFAPFGIFASFLLIPIVSVFLAFGVICTFAACFFPFLVPVLSQLLNFFYGVIDFIAHFFAGLGNFNF